MNELERRLDIVHEKRDILNDAEDAAEVALLIHNWAVRKFNYLVLLTNWVRGDLS